MYLEKGPTEENLNKRILIVDDQEFNIEAMLIILGISCRIDTGKYCVSARSGEEAIKLVGDNIKENDGALCDFELILMDYHMPGKDGYETTKEIRSLMQDNLLPQSIIVCVSGENEEESKEEAYNNGLNHCFAKPV
jgi:two-component system, sensor histidine kinase and response regulator